MLGFFDESGDPGLKIDRGSSRYFVVALVTFAENEPALRCDQRIDELRKELHLTNNYEFHFGKNSWKTREAFLRSVQPFDFQYHIFVLDKSPQTLDNLPFRDSESLYKYTAGLLFENASPYLNEVTVIADKTGSRRFRVDLPRYLQSRVNSYQEIRTIKNVKLQDSHRNNLLQLADYVASIGNQAIHGIPDAIELQEKYLRRKEITRQIWPK